ncbi:MAG: ketoacyl-ACP synthase III [Ruminococcaceae bacterium]|jgi:3-oxoacyl-[acyl-carrier-protein] synthase-3|nr:ketoacyl-ACP synthase III [Oscillospiraceae bacterium]HHV31846.1 ketoacyl-ACP synthase III [Clostridiales bacterium]
MSFKIIGTGSAHPARSVTNDELAVFLDTSDEWIYSRSGIKSRYICTMETILDIAEQAGQAALENAGITGDDLDLIICTTVRGDYITPSMACVLQKRLGAHCPAFDLNGACSGFIYALDVAAGFFARKRVKKVLVVSSCNMSKLLDWTDRSTCVLFGDGAGAVVLGEGDNLLSIHLSAQGDPDVMFIPNVSGNSPFNRTPKPAIALTMHGQDVYKFAVNAMAHDLKLVIEEAGLEQKDIHHVLPHQANIRIINTAIKHLNIPEDRYHTNIETHGNISSAAIPTLMDELNRAGVFHSGEYLALSAFGGGLTTGACVIRWG